MKEFKENHRIYLKRYCEKCMLPLTRSISLLVGIMFIISPVLLVWKQIHQAIKDLILKKVTALKIQLC